MQPAGYNLVLIAIRLRQVLLALVSSPDLIFRARPADSPKNRALGSLGRARKFGLLQVGANRTSIRAFVPELSNLEIFNHS